MPTGEPSLASELRLLRSSLLYADHIDMLAPVATWMHEFAPLRNVDANDPWRTITTLPAQTLRRIGVDDIPTRDFRRAMRRLEALPLTHPQRIETERLWRDAIPNLKTQAEAVFDTRNASEIDLAMQSGIVTMISKGIELEDDADPQITWFRNNLLKALTSPSTHVLLDDDTTAFLRSTGQTTNNLSNVTATRTKHATVGTRLIERLPTFPNAPMHAILETRDELADGRARYRTAAKNLADKLDSTGIDETLPSDINELWHDEVQPALKDLKNTASATRLAIETAKRLTTEGFGIPTLAISIANIPDLITALPTPAAIAAGAGRITTAAITQVLQDRAARRHHDLIYLLETNKRLHRHQP